MTCKLSAIVAVCEDWGIGCEGDMVVSNRADMRHFVACTKGCPVIMGRVEAEVTHNRCVHPVDSYFPDLDADPAWEIVQRSGVATIVAGEGDEGVDYEFMTYRRIEA